jgi:hypothetical protein
MPLVEFEKNGETETVACESGSNLCPPSGT